MLIEFSSAKLPRQDLSLLWGLVVDAAAEQLADEISIEGPAEGPDVPMDVGQAQQHLLAGTPLKRRPRRWRWRRISPDDHDIAGSRTAEPQRPVARPVKDVS